MTVTTKLCVDCAHVYIASFYDVLSIPHPVHGCRRTVKRVNPVDGSKIAKKRLAEIERSNSWFGLDRCGPEGKYWEPKP